MTLLSQRDAAAGSHSGIRGDAFRAGQTDLTRFRSRSLRLRPLHVRTNQPPAVFQNTLDPALTTPDAYSLV